MRGNYFLDLFAGEAGVSRALDREGFKCFSYDVIYGPDGDLTKPHVQKRVKFAILSGKVMGVMLAPPLLLLQHGDEPGGCAEDRRPSLGRARASRPSARKGEHGKPSHEVRPTSGSLVLAGKGRFPGGKSAEQLDVPAPCSEAAHRGGQRLDLCP